ncbi:MAG: enolase C-terminal domain-like protein [Planctomycetaceae bacterium]
MPTSNSSHPSDVVVVGAMGFLLPVRMRVPLKFGAQVADSVTCLRVAVAVRNRRGAGAIGWGETPLSVPWSWPATTSYEARHAAIEKLGLACVREIAGFDARGHAMEIGDDFRHALLAGLAAEAGTAASGDVPELAALVASSAVDLAVHDAFGVVNDIDLYDTYGREHLSRDLADFYMRSGGTAEEERLFRGRYPRDYLASHPAIEMPAWHLVGGLDPIGDADRTGVEPDDGHPVTLIDWIVRDGLTSLKVKLRGTDLDWDVARLMAVGEAGMALGVRRFCADFNCTVEDPAYVLMALDQLATKSPAVLERLLYVEQPFPYDLTAHPIDVHALSSRTRLFLDESAHDWRHVREGRRLGWNGVALKTCKTQTGAIVSLAWARAHGMDIMVQDLTNPMLAAIPHLRLASHAGTLAGVETNAMQFYPEASAAEARIHPDIYRRRQGRVGLASLRGPGFGMRVAEIGRTLPEPVIVAGEIDVDPDGIVIP